MTKKFSLNDIRVSSFITGVQEHRLMGGTDSQTEDMPCKIATYYDHCTNDTNETRAAVSGQ